MRAQRPSLMETFHLMQEVGFRDFDVTPENMHFHPPSAVNPWPSLVSFMGDDFLVSGLRIHITMATPATGWTSFGVPTTRKPHFRSKQGHSPGNENR